MLKGQIIKLRFLAIAVLALVVVSAVLLNTETTQANLPFLTLIAPNVGLFCGTLLIGFAIGIFIAEYT